jgi:formate dehydrogenase maturation protein FdhE
MDKDEIMHLVNATAPKYQSWGCEAHFQNFATQLLQQVEQRVQAEREACIEILSRTEFTSLEHMPSEAALIIRMRGGE